MDIKCRKLTCKFNDNWVCMAKEIEIEKDTQCSTFTFTEKEVEDNTKHIFSKTPIYKNYRHIKDINLKCNADCFFNINGECMSNGITIICSKNPICGIFLKK